MARRGRRQPGRRPLSRRADGKPPALEERRSSSEERPFGDTAVDDRLPFISRSRPAVRKLGALSADLTDCGIAVGIDATGADPLCVASVAEWSAGREAQVGGTVHRRLNASCQRKNPEALVGQRRLGGHGPGDRIVCVKAGADYPAPRLSWVTRPLRAPRCPRRLPQPLRRLHRGIRSSSG